MSGIPAFNLSNDLTSDEVAIVFPLTSHCVSLYIYRRNSEYLFLRCGFRSKSGLRIRQLSPAGGCREGHQHPQRPQITEQDDKGKQKRAFSFPKQNFLPRPWLRPAAPIKRF